MLQFAVLIFIILPILPDKNYGPYEAFNPYQIWLMMVLISGISLTGYVALRFIGHRYGAVLLGVLGGLVSSTATTMVFTRRSEENINLAKLAVVVILLANLTVLIRLAVISAALSPKVLPMLLPVLGSGLILGLTVTIFWWRDFTQQEELPIPETKNPTEFSTAAGFGVLYALVLFMSTWLSSAAAPPGARPGTRLHAPGRALRGIGRDHRQRHRPCRAARSGARRRPAARRGCRRWHPPRTAQGGPRLLAPAGHGSCRPPRQSPAGAGAGSRGEGRQVHPNDDVNRSQSSNDVFPTAMHLAAVEAITHHLLPSLRLLRTTLEEKSSAFDDIVKIGRTHLQDATPLTLGQEISGWAAQIRHGETHLRAALPHLCELALGGTAVGTGLNAPAGYAAAVDAELAELTDQPFVTAPKKFESLASCDALVHAHGVLKTVAASLMKIANGLQKSLRAHARMASVRRWADGLSTYGARVLASSCIANALASTSFIGSAVLTILPCLARSS